MLTPQCVLVMPAPNYETAWRGWRADSLSGQISPTRWLLSCMEQVGIAFGSEKLKHDWKTVSWDKKRRQKENSVDHQRILDVGIKHIWALHVHIVSTNSRENQMAVNSILGTFRVVELALVSSLSSRHLTRSSGAKQHSVVRPSQQRNKSRKFKNLHYSFTAPIVCGNCAVNGCDPKL